MNIVVLKCNSGEEIIGNMVSDNADSMVLDKPRVLIPQQTEQGLSLMLLPYFFSCSEEKITVMKDKVVAKVEGSIPKQVEDNYIQQTSNIQLATA